MLQDINQLIKERDVLEEEGEEDVLAILQQIIFTGLVLKAIANQFNGQYIQLHLVLRRNRVCLCRVNDDIAK